MCVHFITYQGACMYMCVLFIIYIYVCVCLCVHFTSHMYLSVCLCIYACVSSHIKVVVCSRELARISIRLRAYLRMVAMANQSYDQDSVTWSPRFEKLLRMYDPTVSLCYWDSTLEPPVMGSSASWTSSLFGNTNNIVQSGFAAGWITPLGALNRNGGATGRPFSQQVN